ncbi:MAG: alpha-N-acetylglucosaminidase [Bacteroidaceae bacterium]|nr:alpha-N-acetylglucosaminidase [Bacteroidaceae bacterium]
MKKLLTALTLTIAFILTAATATAQAPTATPQEAINGLLDRIGGKGAAQKFVTVIDETLDDANGKDVFIITAQDGKPCIKGNSRLSVAAGINWYLNHHARINLTWNNLTTDLTAVSLPVPAEEERHECNTTYRYDFNTCTFSYSMAFWTWERWQKEIDWMALHGINAPLNLVGLDVVTRNFLKELGVSDSDIADYIAGPGFIAWFAMNNLEGWGGTIEAKDVVMKGNPEWWYARQEQLCRNMLQRMRELGMQPVIPGFSGQVPNCIVNYDIDGFSKNDVINNGNWAGGYTRPDILNPASTSYATFAPIYYKHLEDIMGVSEFYSMDPFHEGSLPGGVTNNNCYPNIMKHLDAYYDGVPAETKEKSNAPAKPKWIIQYWQGVPQSGAFEAMSSYGDRFIGLDLFSDAPGKAKWNSDYFKGRPYIFCMLHNFGGRSGLHGRLETTMNDYFRALAKGNNMQGVGATPEGTETNPILYDMLFELPWMDPAKRPTADEWLEEYAHARYGMKNATALEALQNLKNSVWACPSDQQGTSEAVILARPSWEVKSVSSWSTSAIYWDTQDVLLAADQLVSISELVTTEDGIANYNYDVIDVIRQAMVDYAAELLPLINKARTEKNTAEYERLYKLYLQLMLDLDEMLSYDENFKLERWTSLARNIADEVSGTTDNDRNWLEWNARTQVTVWSKGNTDLHDYSNRCWAGLIKDYHYARWKYFFENNGAAPSGNWHSGFEYPWTVNYTDYDYSKINIPSDMTATEKAVETFGKYFGKVKGSAKNYIFPMGVTRDASKSGIVAETHRGETAELPIEIGKDVAITSVLIDLNADGAFSSDEQLAAEGMKITIPADAEIGKTKANVKFNDGTEITFSLAIIEVIAEERTITVVAGENGTVAIEGSDKLTVTNKEAVTMQAVANTGYNFSNWTDADGNIVSNDNPFIYYGKNDATFKANFIQDKWGIIEGSASSYPDIAGYGQFVQNISFSYYNREPESIYTATAAPAEIFTTIQQIVNVPRGASFDVAYDNGDKDGLKYCYMRAFIDLNADGDFDDEGELVKSIGTAGAQNAAVCNGKINVILPYDTPLGITHMRLRFDGAWDGPTAKTAKEASIRPVYEIIINVTEFSQLASQITVKSNNDAWGTVAVWTDETPDGSTATEWNVTRGVPFTIKAEPADDAEFIGWKDRYGRIVSTELEVTRYACEDAVYTAIFNKGESRKQLGALIEIVEKFIGEIATIEPEGKTTKLQLQTTKQNEAYYLWSNAPDPLEGSISHLTDGIKGDNSNFFHSNWHTVQTAEGYHFIETDLGEENVYSRMQIAYHTRTGCSDDFPDAITVMGSYDKKNYSNVYTVNSGLPQGVNQAFASDYFNCGRDYRYLRFKVDAERTYWHMGEFELYAKSSKAALNESFNDIVTAADVERLYDMTTVAKYLYDNSIDNNELDAAYEKLNRYYLELQKSTSITSINTAEAADSVYDLSGRRLEENADAGIYIVNGKKVMVRNN